MSGTMKYRGYVGSVDFSEDDGVLFGRLLGIRSVILYEGTTAKELVAGFHEAVDEYLLACEEEGIEPEMPYKGSFNVRITPPRASCALCNQCGAKSQFMRTRSARALRCDSFRGISASVCLSPRLPIAQSPLSHAAQY